MECMGVGEAAKVWGVSRATVKRWCESKHARSEKIAGRWLIEKQQPIPMKLREDNYGSDKSRSSSC